MPTPVSIARQCLSDPAAMALDDAVTVAKRRSHAQTTSLHAISALLGLPSSSLREACTRARSSAYTPRLQFRALELCVGVALDRVSVSKSASDLDPPVSNSLMAAIKRSQANQRRNPETFNLYQQQQVSSNCSSQPSICAVKVELKHFVISILDDPIVSRVFSDAGFGTNDLKLTILNPLTVSRFSAISHCPPLFSCSLSDLGFNKRSPNFPFHVGRMENFDENSSRVGKIIVRRSMRNPLLIGVYAGDALNSFITGIQRGETEVLPKEIDGLSVISVEREVSEFVNGVLSEEMMGLKLKEVGDVAEDCKGAGVIVNFGDLKYLIDVESVDLVNYICSEVKRLLEKSRGRLWLIGFLSGDDDYRKLVERFPSVEMEWDLHLLPITSSSGGKGFKSSLMGSFVPFGGFFSMPHEQETVCSGAKSSGLCMLCDKKYEKEVSVLKGASIDSENLSYRLQMAECETSQRLETVETKDDKAVLVDARAIALQGKWSDICQRLHSSNKSQEENSSVSNSKSLTFSIRSSKINVPKPVTFGIDANTRGEIQNSTSPVISLTTDLGLGNLYASSAKEGRRKENLKECSNTSTQNFSESSKTGESFPPEKQMYFKDLESPWKILAEKVFWQIEAIQTISRTVSVKHSKKGNVWLSFLGPDQMGKRKIAASLAEIIFCREEKFLSFDLSSQDPIKPFNSIFNFHDSKYRRMNSERKLIVDCLAEELNKRSCSVVLLENIENADFLVQNSLSQAVKSGRFQDSHGRDVNTSNILFVLTLGDSGRVSKDFACFGEEFSEKKILEAKNQQMQILVRSINGDFSNRSTTSVSVTPGDEFHNNKRKLTNHESDASKRVCSIIDLNLPVENTEEDIVDDDKMWLKEFLEQVDENVVFKPFDFDSLKRKILNEIDVRLRKIVGPKIVLEIDREVMIQLLAAAWLTESKNGLEDWVDNVLFSSLMEARKRRNVSSDAVMKLVPCDGLVHEEASGVRLPARIHVE